MPFPQLPSRFRLILRFTVIAAVVGAVYSEIHVAEAGAPLFAVYGVARGIMTGAVIAAILSSLQVFILTGPLGAPYRRAPFPVHVAIKTGIYLIVILFGLALGAWVFPAPAEPGIERRDVLFSLALAFVFAFISSTYVPAGTMPGWLQPFARYQPITPMVTAVRSLIAGSTSDLGLALAWSALLIVVLTPIAVLRYRRT